MRTVFRPGRQHVLGGWASPMAGGTHTEVKQVYECPANLLAHAGYGIDDDLASEDENGMNKPCA